MSEPADTRAARPMPDHVGRERHLRDREPELHRRLRQHAHHQRRRGRLHGGNVWLWVSPTVRPPPIPVLPPANSSSQTTSTTPPSSKSASTPAAASSSTAPSGPIWMYGTAVEHHTLYRVPVSLRRRRLRGPHPDRVPLLPAQPARAPRFLPRRRRVGATRPASARARKSAWGLRVVGAPGVRVYGAGLYSFFVNTILAATCAQVGNGEACQKPRVLERGERDGFRLVLAQYGRGDEPAHRRPCRQWGLTLTRRTGLWIVSRCLRLRDAVVI